MLKRVTPYTKRGEPGMVYIMDDSALDAWIQREGQGLLDAGYARIVITDYVKSTTVGDRRRRR